VKIVLAVHAYPPEGVGGTELLTQALAQELARAGHAVLVVSGSLEVGSGTRASQDGDVRVLRLRREDLYFDHWQKGTSYPVRRAWRELLAAERPDVVHVQHWLRLSNELVLDAAHAGVPAVVSLHDHTTSCLLAFRVRPEDGAACEASYGPMACVSCAGKVAPRTPWVPIDQQYLSFAMRRSTLERELTLARKVCVPSAAHAAALLRFGVPDVGLEVVAPLGPVLARRTAPTGSTPFTLGVWGIWSPLKGTDLIVQAARESGVRLVLAGRASTPEFDAELRALAEGSVEFHGPFEARDLATHAVTNVHAMVCGSRAPESYGRVLDEARALGLPAILPNAGAFAERADSGVHFYTPGDGPDLVRAIRALADDSARLAAMRAEVPLPDPTGMDAYLALYAAAIEQGAPASADLPQTEWFEERMAEAAQAEWDAGCSRTPEDALGAGDAT